MRRPRSRRRFVLLAVLAVVLALCVAGWSLRPRLERAIRARIEAESARRGLVAKVATVRVGLWPPLRLGGVSIESRSKWRLSAEVVEGWWRGQSRLVVESAFFQGPAGITLAAKS